MILSTISAVKIPVNTFIKTKHRCGSHLKTYLKKKKKKLFRTFYSSLTKLPVDSIKIKLGDIG